MQYQVFDLWVGARRDDGYPVRAASNQGEVSGLMKLYSLADPIQASLKRMDDMKTDADFLIEFGTFLYNSLFTGELESLFQNSLGAVDGQDEQGLRIRLRIEPPEISILPWEFLYSPKKKYYLGASRKTPLTRYLEVFQRIPTLHAVLPLKILVAIPSMPGIDIPEEKRVLEEAVENLKDVVQLKFLEGGVTRQTLADALLENRYAVFHFIGHGGFKDNKGLIRINHQNGGGDDISDRIFAQLFIDQPSIKLIILNSCKGAKVSESQPMVGMAPKLVERGIPAVIAHQYSVSDVAAIRFAREFYRSLCKGSERGCVDVAVAHARNQLSFHFSDDRSLGAPVLFMRAENGLIFDITVPSLSPTGQPPDPILVLSSDEINHLKRLLEIHINTARVLEEQIAKMGILAPPYLKLQLDETKETISELKRKLGGP